MKASKHIEFETKRLILNACSTKDADIVLALLNSPLFIRYVGDRHVENLEEAKNYIKERMLPQMERLGYGNYTMIRKVDNVKLGTCGLFDRPGIDGIDIGFGMLEEFHGKGYAFEAARCIRDAAFNEFGIKLLRGITVKENTSSRRLLEKLGLVYVKDIRLPSDSTDLMLYELDIKQFKNQ